MPTAALKKSARKPRRPVAVPPPPATVAARLAKPRRRPGPPSAAERAAAPTAATRDLVFVAAANTFAAHGYAGTSVDAVAQEAGVNKAMLYYHFDGKLGLYREVIRDMLRAVGSGAADIAASDDAAPRKIERFIAMMCDMRHARPWFPPLMLREMSDGAPHLDPDTFALLRAVFMAFGQILQQGHAAGHFRPVNPVLAYMSVMGPLLMNAARERVAARHQAPAHPGTPVFVTVDRQVLLDHMQHAALQMLAVAGDTPSKDRSR